MIYTEFLPIQLITVSIISLQKESVHQSITNAAPLRNSYDYIVVGAGSAGAPLADPPALAIPLWREYPLFDWDYKTVPQRHGLALRKPGVFVERRGKVIGGTSTINGLIHLIGSRHEYDEWVNGYGAKGWSYAEVLPYFKKLENNSDHQLAAKYPEYHGTKGPIGIQSDPAPQPLLQKLQKVYNQLGFPTTDLNGPNMFGTAFTQMSIKEGYRSGTGNAYIDPNRHPNNLFIQTNALVTRIRLARMGDEIIATGVEVVINKKKYRINADIEVIISAGKLALLVPCSKYFVL